MFLQTLSLLHSESRYNDKPLTWIFLAPASPHSNALPTVFKTGLSKQESGHTTHPLWRAVFRAWSTSPHSSAWPEGSLRQRTPILWLPLYSRYPGPVTPGWWQAPSLHLLFPLPDCRSQLLLPRTFCPLWPLSVKPFPLPALGPHRIWTLWLIIHFSWRAYSSLLMSPLKVYSSLHFCVLSI